LIRALNAADIRRAIIQTTGSGGSALLGTQAMTARGLGSPLISFDRRTAQRRPRCHGPAAVFLLSAVFCLVGQADVVQANVVVLANRTARDVGITLNTEGTTRSIDLRAGQVLPIPTTGNIEIRHQDAGRTTRYDLQADAAYYFALDLDQRCVLHEIDLGRETRSDQQAAPSPTRAMVNVGEIPIKIFVDDKEPTTQRVWEARLRKRVEAASRIIERTCRVRLKIVGVGRWHADASIQDVQKALAQFRKLADPNPAWVAIGFTSMYRDAPGRFHLGGAQGLLQSHILIRERSPKMSETERLEVLVHELGHYLGASHSPDPNSVMRPLLGDDRSALKSFQIGFDPVNTLITYLVGEEIRRGVHTPAGISPGTRRRLEEIYQAICQANPNDDSARQMQFQLALGGASPRARGTRQVIQAVVEAASKYDRDARRPRQVGKRNPDDLTEQLVRSAARAAGALPDRVARSSLLLGLGIALDSSDALLRNALTREFCRAVESDADRARRHRLVTQVTVLGRTDLAQHFFLSAYLTTIAGRKAAETAGLGKELLDSQGGSGFSYVDLAADLAGIAFAERVLTNSKVIDRLANHFTVVDHMPSTDGLPEGLSWDRVWGQLSGSGDESLSAYRRKIHARIQQLPAARPDASTGNK